MALDRGRSAKIGRKESGELDHWPMWRSGRRLTGRLFHEILKFPVLPPSGQSRFGVVRERYLKGEGDGMSVDSLHEEVRGEVFTDGDEGYDEARSVYNAMIDKRPAVMIGAVDDADVITGVRYAAESGLDGIHQVLNVT